MYPESGFAIKTHPTAQECFDNLVRNINISKGFESKNIEKIIDNSKRLKEWLCEDLTINYDAYEVYGSVYLDKPNTE